jgi:hypothetical protein
MRLLIAINFFLIELILSASRSLLLLTFTLVSNGSLGIPDIPKNMMFLHFDSLLDVDTMLLPLFIRETIDSLNLVLLLIVLHLKLPSLTGIIDPLIEELLLINVLILVLPIDQVIVNGRVVHKVQGLLELVRVLENLFLSLFLQVSLPHR